MSRKKTSSSQSTPAPHHPSAKSRSNRVFWALTLPLTILAAIALGALIIPDLIDNRNATRTQTLAPAESGPTPAAWTYDAVNNRHWDPLHNHWHDGPPPEDVDAPIASTPPAANIEPWFYDEANDQHWDPGHNHWHRGPPPPPEQREVSTGPTTEPPTGPEQPESQPD